MLEREDNMKSFFVINLVQWDKKEFENYIYYHLKDALDCLERLGKEFNCTVQQIHDKHYIAKNDKCYISYNEWIL
jgi:hypothetical protein